MLPSSACAASQMLSCWHACLVSAIIFIPSPWPSFLSPSTVSLTFPTKVGARHHQTRPWPYLLALAGAAPPPVATGLCGPGSTAQSQRSSQLDQLQLLIMLSSQPVPTGADLTTARNSASSAAFSSSNPLATCRSHKGTDHGAAAATD